LDRQKNEIAKIETRIAQPDFWTDQDEARQIRKRYEDLKFELAQWEKLKEGADNLAELAAADFLDEQLEREVARDFQLLQNRFYQLDFAVLFSATHDKENAILSIHAGTGGVDAQDWAEMLLRMYLRFCEQHQLLTRVIDRSDGSEAGIKSVTIEVEGRYAYGWLKSENGVHRLVRISPFDAEKMRHTSFALVEVLPEIEDVEVEIKDDDLKVEVMRAGGHGGQSVNTTDSAVRITHLPTKISVKCQNERSQLQNKKMALKILKSKLLKYYEESEAKKVEQLKGDYQQAQWGNQARSYVLQPYKLVKDHRTDYETADVDRVLDGGLEDFIEDYLRQQIKK
jgi:peptide chain release factor 2